MSNLFLTIHVWITVLRYSIYRTRISCFQAEIYNSFALTGNNSLLLERDRIFTDHKVSEVSILKHPRATSTALHGLGRSSTKSIFYVGEIRGCNGVHYCARYLPTCNETIVHRAVSIHIVATVSVMLACLGAVDGLFTRRENLRR